jgi:hypothetical protein
MPLPSLPTVGSDVDSWGTDLNAYLTALAARPQLVPGWTSGRWYAAKSAIPSGHGSTQALLANYIYATPIWVPEARAIDKVGFAVQAGVAASNARLMAHAMLDNGLPGDLIADFGLVGTATAGDKEIDLLTTTLPAGLLYLTCIPDAAIVAYKFDFGNWQGLGATGQAGEVGSPYRNSGGTTAPNPFGTSGVGYFTVGVLRLAVRAA